MIFSFESGKIRKFLNSQRGSAASFSIADSFSEIPEFPRVKENEVFAEIASGYQKSRIRFSEGELSKKCFIQNLWNSGDSAWDPQRR